MQIYFRAYGMSGGVKLHKMVKKFTSGMPFVAPKIIVSGNLDVLRHGSRW